MYVLYVSVGALCKCVYVCVALVCCRCTCVSVCPLQEKKPKQQHTNKGSRATRNSWPHYGIARQLFCLVALAGSTVLIGGAPNFLPCPPRVRERCRWCARVAVLHCHRCAQPVCQVHFIVCFACGSDFCSGGCYYGHDCHPPFWLSPLPHHYHFVCVK